MVSVMGFIRVPRPAAKTIAFLGTAKPVVLRGVASGRPADSSRTKSLAPPEPDAPDSSSGRSVSEGDERGIAVCGRAYRAARKCLIFWSRAGPRAPHRRGQ